MKLSDNFALSEFVGSTRAQILQIKNEPNAVEIERLRKLCINVMQPLSNYLHSPIRITSGFRCYELNAAVGGTPSSQHRYGEACDFTCSDMKKAFEFLLFHTPFDQLIWEHGTDDQPEWIHVSYSNRHRRQVLRKYTGEKKYRPYNTLL